MVSEYMDPRVLGRHSECRYPTMLVRETVGEILQTSQFVREIVTTSKKTSMDDPKTPVTQKEKTKATNRKHRTNSKEKQGV